MRSLFKRKSKAERFYQILDQDSNIYREKSIQKWERHFDKAFKYMKKNGVPEELKEYLAFRFPFHCWEYDLKEMEEIIFQTKEMDVRLVEKGLVPTSIGKLTNLERLTIAANSLKTLPEEVGHLKKLTLLNLGNNLIEEFPSVIFKLINLEELILTINNLVNVPKDIVSLKTLKILQLNNNELTTFPIEILGLFNLKMLGLMGNQISSIPSSITAFQHLEKLLLARNPIKNIPSNVSQLSQLKWLNLRSTNVSENHINEIKHWLPNIDITF